jgi:AhpD family alkylhydroperoxidase
MNMGQKQRYDEALESYKHLTASNPEAMAGFSKYFKAIEKDGALSPKFKQILMVGLSIGKQCEWCIAYHTQKALTLGATKEELMETCFVASVMGGGPAMMYSRMVVEGIDDFFKKKDQTSNP